MQPLPDISIIIPAYNEQARLEPTVREAVEYCRAAGRRLELLVVDDGSTDGTGALVQRLGDEFSEVRLLRLAENRGKGFAVRTGVVNARGALVLFEDADGSTPIAELDRLEAHLSAGADVAIGSRAQRGGAVVRAKLYRRVIGRCFHALVSGLTVRGFRDTQCGFKLFRAAAAHDLFSRMRMGGFSFDVEVLLMAQRQGYVIAEVPVNWVHKPGSKVNLALDSLKMARDLLVIRSRMLRGEYRVPHVTPYSRPEPTAMQMLAGGIPTRDR